MRSLRLGTLSLIGSLFVSGCGAPAPADDCAIGAWCLVRGGPAWTVDGDRARASVVAMGPRGAFLAWDADHWVRTDVPTTTTITSACVDGAGNAWASDGASAWRRDGARWSAAPAATDIRRVFVAWDGSVWAVAGGAADGRGGIVTTLLRRDGDRWTEPAAAPSFCIGVGAYAVLSPEDVFTAGYVCDDSGAVRGVEVRRWNASAWQTVGSTFAPSSAALSVIDGRVRVSAGGAFEWDGTRWQAIAIPDYPQGLPPSLVAWPDGLGYTTMPTSLGCESAYRLDDARVWCFGSGQIYFDDGRSWSPTLDDPFADTASPSAWGRIPPTLWAGSDAVLAWGASATDVFRARASTGSTLEHFDGTRWSMLGTDRVFSLDGSGTGDVWIATEGGLLHADGDDLVPVAIPDALFTSDVRMVVHVRSIGPGAVMVSTGEQVLSYDGVWSVRYEAPPGWWIDSIAGGAEDDLYLTEQLVSRVSSASAVRHFDGRAWSQVSDLAGHVATSGGQTWLSAGARTQRLDASLPALPEAITLDTFSETTLWAGPDALWLSAPGVTQRYTPP